MLWEVLFLLFFWVIRIPWDHCLHAYFWAQVSFWHWNVNVIKFFNTTGGTVGETKISSTLLGSVTGLEMKLMYERETGKKYTNLFNLFTCMWGSSGGKWGPEEAVRLQSLPVSDKLWGFDKTKRFEPEGVRVEQWSGNIWGGTNGIYRLLQEIFLVDPFQHGLSVFGDNDVFFWVQSIPEPFLHLWFLKCLKIIKMPKWHILGMVGKFQTPLKSTLCQMIHKLIFPGLSSWAVQKSLTCQHGCSPQLLHLHETIVESDKGVGPDGLWVPL